MFIKRTIKMKQKNTRAAQRFPCKFPVSFLALGSRGHPQVINAVSSEIMDLSENGMRIRLQRQTLEEGTVLLVKVPQSSAPVTVPSLAQVRWIKAGKSRTCEAGLKYVIE
jgi:hypothetical protein